MIRRFGSRLFLSLICAGILGAATLGPTVRAQNTPFVSDRIWQLLNGELSADASRRFQ